MIRYAALCALPLLASCMTNSEEQVLATDTPQMTLRSLQSRSFATGDEAASLRSVIATLQDLGFAIERTDDVLGTVTGQQTTAHALRMTVTVRPTRTGMVVRASAQYGLNAVSDPAPYVQFFAELSRTMSLPAAPA